MAFVSMIFVGALLVISIIGAILSIVGITLLIIYLAKKAKKKKGFLIVSIILLIIGTPMTLVLPGFMIIAKGVANVSIDGSTNPNEYPVVNAIKKRDNRKLKQLLKNSADPNEVFDGRPAIFWTCCNFDNGVNYEAAKLLINYNADLNSDFPLMKSTLIGTQRYNDQSEIFKIVGLLLDEGYDVNETDDDGVTLLMYATSKSRYGDEHNLPYDITVLFVDRGADISAVDNKGRTVLMWACGSEYRKDAANIGNINVDVPTIKGKNQFAQYDYNIIKYLIDNGADVKAKDNDGFTALDYFMQAQENSKIWADYYTIGQSEDYIKKCSAIEELLK